MWKSRPLWKKIISLIALAIILILAGSYLFRNSLLKSYLPSVLAKSTNNEVSLTLNKIHLGLDGDLYLLNPKLNFRNTFIDKSKSMELKELYFDTIHLYGASIGELLFSKSFIADSLYVTRPKAIFKEQQGEQQAQFDLNHLISIMESNPNQDIEQQVKIGRIIIDYGTLQVDPLMDEGNKIDEVDYTVYIKNFSTLAEDQKKSGRIFFSDDIQFRIDKIDKLLISGYDLDLGSLYFSILKNRLSISGVKLFPRNLPDSINQIALAAKRIEFNGLSFNEISGKDEIELQSARISDGYFITNNGNSHKSKQAAHNEFFSQLADKLVEFRLDTLGIHNFNFEFLKDLSDTIANLEHLNLELYGVLIDSSMMDDLFRELDFDEFVFTSGKGSYDLPSPELRVFIDSISYNSKSERAELFKLNIGNQKAESNLQFLAGKITIDGISEDPLPKPLKMHLKIDIRDINGQIDLGNQIFHQKSEEQGSNAIFDFVQLDSLSLHNSSLEIFKKAAFNLHVNNLDTRIKDPFGLTDGKISANLDEFFLQAEKIDFTSTSGMQLNGQDLNINRLDVQFGQITCVLPGRSGNSRLKLDRFSLKGFILHELINNERIIGDIITAGRVRISGNIDIPGKSPGKAKQRDETALFSLPFTSIEINKVSFPDIQIDQHAYYEAQDIALQSQLDIHLEEIRFEGQEVSTNDLANIHGHVKLKSTAAKAYGHMIELDELSIDLTHRNLSLKRLHIEQESSKQDANIQIKQLMLPAFEITNIKLDRLEDQKLIFQDLSISDLTLEMALLQDINNKEVKNSRSFDPGDIMNIEYSDLELDNINVNIEFVGASSNPEISLNNFHLKHTPKGTKDDNLMDDISFNFGAFSFLDSLRHDHFRIQSGLYQPAGNHLQLSNISGGNLQKGKLGDANRPGWSYSSNSLLISELFIKNSIPSKLEMGKLYLSDANLAITTELQTQKNTSLGLDIETFREIGDLMTRLSVDTTVFSEVRVQYRTFDDTSSHVFLADSIGLVINNIDIDTNVFEHASTSIVKKMSIDLKGRTQISKDSLYEIRSGIISYDFKRDVISVDSFQVIPRYEDAEFFRRARYQTDRMSLFGRRIEIHDFRLEELIENNIIHAGSVDVDSIFMEMTRDKTYARKENDFKFMPQEMLRMMNQKFTVDSVRVFNSFVRYSEYVEKSSQPGSIFFDRFTLNLYDITSNLPHPDPSAALKVDLESYVMGQSRFNVNLVFPYLSDSNDFWMNASSEPLDLTILNPLTENLLGLSIKQGNGRIENTFITGNKHHSIGSMIFSYKKLKLSLYNRKKAERNKGMFGGITRFLINDILIHSNNPKFAKEPRVGQVYFERDIEKSIINYTWKSLLSGMLSSVGINKKEQRQEKRETKGK